MATHDTRVIGDYLSVVVLGPLDQPLFRQITDEMLEICEKKDLHKVVIDVSAAAGTFNNEDKIEFAKYASAKLKDIIFKYAYVYPHHLLNYSSQQVASGRGLSARAYYTVEDAIKWMEAE
ncbi:MAG: hypothetical protein GKR93_16555 [Gammaproteobacteria bacterium]|nr:hypothetical protein [Gammaproteobacteria bacterium]